MPLLFFLLFLLGLYSPSGVAEIVLRCYADATYSSSHVLICELTFLRDSTHPSYHPNIIHLQSPSFDFRRCPCLYAVHQYVHFRVMGRVLLHNFPLPLPSNVSMLFSPHVLFIYRYFRSPPRLYLDTGQ